MDTKQNIFTRLCKAQSEFPNIAKDKKASAFKGGSYQYADINDILTKVMPILNANGLSLIQKTTGTETTVTVETVLFSTEGESLSSGGFTVSTKDLMQRGVQAHGSAVTYARRYSLAAFLGLAYGDDDDGRKATEHHDSKPAQKPVQKPVPAPSPSRDYLEFKKLIESASNTTELMNVANAMKMKTDMPESELNSLRALWVSQKEELSE